MVRAARAARWRQNQGSYGLKWLALGGLGFFCLPLSACHAGIHAIRGGSRAARGA